MTLNTDRWIVRYYLWLVRVMADKYAVERRLHLGTTLCAFGWRIVIGTTIIAALTLMGIFLLSVLAYAVLFQTIETAKAFGFIFGTFGGIALLSILIGRATQAGRSIAHSGSIAVEWLRTMKRGVCPLIEFKQKQ